MTAEDYKRYKPIKAEWERRQQQIRHVNSNAEDGKWMDEKYLTAK